MYLEYISLSRYDIPELVDLIMISFMQGVSDNKEANEPRVPSSYVEVIISSNVLRSPT
jgi:hypothetical protein